MNFIFPVVAFALASFVTGFAWWMMAQRPGQWARWVEKENSYWVGKRLISPATAERMKRWETSNRLRLLLAVATLAGMIGLAMTTSVLARAIALSHRQPRLLYNPSLQMKPVVRPGTNRPPANRTATNQPPHKAASNAPNKHYSVSTNNVAADVSRRKISPTSASALESVIA